MESPAFRGAGASLSQKGSVDLELAQITKVTTRRPQTILSDPETWALELAQQSHTQRFPSSFLSGALLALFPRDSSPDWGRCFVVL